MVYKAGGIMKTQVDVVANHGGFWEMSICDSTDISQECFDRNVLKTCAPHSLPSHTAACIPRSLLNMKLFDFGVSLLRTAQGGLRGERRGSRGDWAGGV